jgi:hypothetical protein
MPVCRNREQTSQWLLSWGQEQRLTAKWPIGTYRDDGNWLSEVVGQLEELTKNHGTIRIQP